jgi:hypothetical protein
MRYFKLLVKRRYCDEQGNYIDGRSDLRLSNFSRLKNSLSAPDKEFLLNYLGQPFTEDVVSDTFVLLKDHKINYEIRASFRVSICKEIDEKEFTSISMVTEFLKEEIKYFLKL